MESRRAIFADPACRNSCLAFTATARMACVALKSVIGGENLSRATVFNSPLTQAIYGPATRQAEASVGTVEKLLTIQGKVYNRFCNTDELRQPIVAQHVQCQ